MRQFTSLYFIVFVFISIHAPHERCDVKCSLQERVDYLFQSTHRMSDATPLKRRKQPTQRFQSTHRMSDATNNTGIELGATIISIHAPHERCDYKSNLYVLIHFISIHAPHERCDTTVAQQRSLWSISIHAPHERCDGLDCGRPADRTAFQSTHRMSDATLISLYSSLRYLFQSTHRMSDAT